MEFKSGASAIIIHEKKILLFLRDDIPTIPFPNRWSLVGGQKEEGESFDETIVRELEEEISYAPKNLNKIGKFTYINNATAVIYIAFISDDEAAKIKHQGDEGQEIRFFSIEEIKKLKTTPLIKNYIFKYEDIINRVINENYIPKPKEIGLSHF